MKGMRITWTERPVRVRSITLAAAARDALDARLTTAQAEVGDLNEHNHGTKRSHDVVSVEQAARAILTRHRATTCSR